MFAGEGERLEITHRAQSRNFAQARCAVSLCMITACLYSMNDLLGKRRGLTVDAPCQLTIRFISLVPRVRYQHLRRSLA